MNSGSTAMVFKSPIDGVTRARVFYLCRLKGFSVRKVAEICNISRGSVCRIAKEKLLRKSIPKTIFKRGPKFKLRMCGHFFATFIKMNFTRLFMKADKGTNRLWIQDGDPSQNLGMVRSAMRRANSTLIKLPPRSPNLNCIENLFPIVQRILKKQALERGIKRESFKQFKARDKAAILSIPVRTINHIRGSMHKRMSLVITNKGRHLNY